MHNIGIWNTLQVKFHLEHSIEGLKHIFLHLKHIFLNYVTHYNMNLSFPSKLKLLL